MKSHDPKNERIKRDYLTFLKEAKRYSETSLDGVAHALHRFEAFTRFRDFRQFHRQQAIAFKSHLADQTNPRTGKALSKATLLTTLNALKAFFLWLAGQPGYRAALSYADAEYFNLSEKETRIARAHREQRHPTIDQIRRVISDMAGTTDTERRDRALIAFAILTGVRDGALASLKLRHVDLIEGMVDQDARDVRTKFSKTIVTYFFPVGDDMRKIVADWIEYLRLNRLWGPDDPLFPATHVALGECRRFQASGLARTHWASSAPIRRIFKDAFAHANIPYANPHSFRRTLALLSETMCKTPEEVKAWSQNLGHEGVLTTFYSYGEVAVRRQAEIIRQLAIRPEQDDGADRLAATLAQVIRGSGAFHSPS